MTHSPILVAIPLYNALPFIEKAIRSMLEQTYSEFKLLIVNDGSTDGSETAARAFKDSRIVVRDQANRGVASVMNTAIAYASDERIPYIACMAADDIAMPERLRVQLNFMESHPAAAACGSNSYYIDARTEEIIGSSTVPVTGALIRWEVFHGLRGMIEGASMFRTSALQAVGGFRPYFLQAEDTDIFLRLAERYDLANVPEYLYKIRLNRDGLSVKNYRKNVSYHFYALDCSHRRKRGQREMAFAEFESTLGFLQNLKIWKEIKFLEFWRDYLERGDRLSLAAASLLSPARLISRILRWLERKYRFGG
jgi:glycosyltransferase involved in cell wall biosynthesis